MSRRVITPFSDGPSKSFLEELTGEATQINDGSTGEFPGRKSKSRRRRSKKSMSEEDGKKDEVGGRERRMDRQISVSSEKSVLSEEEEPQTETAKETTVSTITVSTVTAQS